MDSIDLSLKNMSKDLYGEKIEDIFEKMYRGNKESFSDCCEGIIAVLANVMKKGFLTYSRYDAVRDVLENSYNNQKCTVISNDSEVLTILNKETETLDCFSLTDMISWLVAVMISDTLFRKQLKDRYDYAGVINGLNCRSSSQGLTRVNFSAAVNAVTCGDYLYIADKKNDVTELIRIRKSGEEFALHPTIEQIMLLESEVMFPDPERNCFYVNNSDGQGRKIQLDNGMVTKIDGKVAGLSDLGEVIVAAGSDLLIVREGTAETKIGTVSNVILNSDENSGVSWIQCDDNELRFCWYRNGEMSSSHDLKAECVWKYIVKNGYCFHPDPEKKMSYTLWLHKCCRLPVPFTSKSILVSISNIEAGITKGYVDKSPKYTFVVGPLLTLNTENEDVTDALFNHFHIQREDIDCTYHNVNTLASWDEVLFHTEFVFSKDGAKKSMDTSDRIPDALDMELARWIEG